MGAVKTIAVAYDRGAVNAAEIAIGLGDLGRLIFVGHESGDASPLMPLLRELGEVVTLERRLDEVAEDLRATGTDAVVTFSDAMMPVAGDLAHRLGLLFHSPETVKLLTNKAEQRERLRMCGVEDVRTRQIGSLTDWPAALATVGLPAVLKPVHGQGSRDTYLITDRETGSKLVAELFSRSPSPAFVLEEYLAGRPSLPFGDYVSVESVSTPAGVVHLAVTGKHPTLPPFREVGQFWPSPLSGAEERHIENLVERALTALGVETGISHTEIKLTKSGPRIIEVNGRMGGHINDLYRRAHGRDLVELAGRLALGDVLPATPPRPDQVFFQYNTPAPVPAATLIRTEGVDELRRLPGISGYRPYYDPGTSLPAAVMTRPLDLVSGVAGDHEQMAATLDAALETLSFVFDTDAGRIEISAAELGERAATSPSRT